MLSLAITYLFGGMVFEALSMFDKRSEADSQQILRLLHKNSYFRQQYRSLTHVLQMLPQ